MTGPVHLHGSMVACCCGSEYGITTIAVGEEYEPPEACPTCGKPRVEWGNNQPAREVNEHDQACSHHPNAVRCPGCSEVGPYGVVTVWHGGGDARWSGCQGASS